MYYSTTIASMHVMSPCSLIMHAISLIPNNSIVFSPYSPYCGEVREE